MFAKVNFVSKLLTKNTGIGYLLIEILIPADNTIIVTSGACIVLTYILTGVNVDIWRTREYLEQYIKVKTNSTCAYNIAILIILGLIAGLLVGKYDFY